MLGSKRFFLALKIGQMVFWNQPGGEKFNLIEWSQSQTFSSHSIEYKIIPAWYSPSTTRLFLSSIKAAISLKAAKIIL